MCLCTLKFIKKNLSSKIFEAVCVLNLAMLFLAGLKENFTVLYFLLLLRGAAGTGRFWGGREKPAEERSPGAVGCQYSPNYSIEFTLLPKAKSFFSFIFSHVSPLL